ncbi:hypothetical protein [Fulvivirga sedimenti]|uniref:N-acetyltransferase n=1 Tax=Fulvivirga sedimenti TaxID=2879465 RepID=A0A9X1HUT9_9BACT|nr:hypothetical protein [Fulvivirga sedimenti]MCA6078300.1 hypothetical protein [Fulvivirga sedimenti]
MKIVEVTDSSLAREFLLFPLSVYRNTKTWIRPLDKDIEAVFDPKKNKAFRSGECCRWVAMDSDGKVTGRIAAFVNKKTALKGNDQPTGGLGFFECTEDREVAFALFDTARKWLEEKGMEAMDGPINFGERDKWWGLLVDGFDLEPNYNCNYNPPYYQQFFEDYGFQIYFKQFTFGRKVREPFHPRLYEKAKKAMENPGYRFEHLRLKNLDKYTEDFRVVYNKAWARHTGVAEMSSLQAKAIMKQMKPIIDEKIIWFGYYENEPVAFYINLPEVNQIFKHVNGKLNWIGKLKFLYHKTFKTCKKMLGLVFGVVPEHQGKGLEGALVIATAGMVQEAYTQYDDLEMNWIGDFNPKMIRVVEQVGGDIVKTHHTYRKLFDETKEFKRAPMQ